MTMSRKDYKMLAQVFKNERLDAESRMKLEPNGSLMFNIARNEIDLCSRLAESIGEVLALDNLNFDWHKWRLAIHGTEM